MSPPREWTAAEFVAGKVPGFPKAGGQGRKGRGRTPKTPRALRLVLPDRIEIEAPVVVIPEANAHDPHWTIAHRRHTDQQAEAAGLFAWLPRCPLPPPWHVRLVLLAPERAMDCDNEVSGWKWVRDEVARWLGCGDGRRDPVTWETGFEERAERGIKIVVERRKGGV